MDTTEEEVSFKPAAGDSEIFSRHRGAETPIVFGQKRQARFHGLQMEPIS